MPHPARPAVAALFALDQRLGAIVATTTQPMVGQLRMTWWHDALTTLKPGDRRGEPVLDALAAHVLTPGDGGGPMLARLVEGWEGLLDPPPLADDVLAAHGDARGAALFSLVARAMGGTSDDAAGRGWALADYARRSADADTAARARTMAADAFAAARIATLPRPLRALARLAGHDVRGGGGARRSLMRLIASIR